MINLEMAFAAHVLHRAAGMGSLAVIYVGRLIAGVGVGVRIQIFYPIHATLSLVSDHKKSSHTE